MVQSLKLGGAPDNRRSRRMRRLNRLPIIVAIVLVVLFLGVIFYGLSSRGLVFPRRIPDIGEGPGGTSGIDLRRRSSSAACPTASSASRPSRGVPADA
jgi:hypothetical protein